MATEVDPSEASRTTQVVRLAPCPDVEEAARRLATSLADRAPAQGDATQGFFRMEIPVAAAAPLEWLARRAHPTRLHFETPDGRLALAGLGFARTWSDGLGELRALAARLAADPASEALRFLVTNRFGGLVAADSDWAAFGDTRICLPLVEFRRDGDGARLAVNLDLAPEAVGASLADALGILGAHADPDPQPPEYRVVLLADEPDEVAWSEAVSATLADIEEGRMAKCVLARTRTYAIDGALDPFALLARAAGEQPDTFRFGIQVSADRAFVGATPEVLFRRRGEEVESEALAGTRRREGNPTRDEARGAELLESEKDLQEHAFVREHIEAVLAPLCGGKLEIEGPRLRRLVGLQHLDTRLKGTLHRDASDADLLAKLHPTPAVCGVPTEEAREAIERREPFDRGLYAGAVGIVGRDEAVLTVGIRSALHLGDRVTLLAGAGIVKGSQPDAEWNETGDKMRVLDAILRSGRA